VTLGGVAREAARVAQLTILEMAVRMDHHVLDRAVLAAQPRRLVVQGAAGAQGGEDVADDVGVDVEIGDMAADVVVPGIAEHLQLGAVGPQDGAVAGHAVQAFSRVFHEVRELPFALAQGQFSCLAAHGVGVVGGGAGCVVGGGLHVSSSQIGYRRLQACRADATV
jgi:hypothetical protein